LKGVFSGIQYGITDINTHSTELIDVIVTQRISRTITGVLMDLTNLKTSRSDTPSISNLLDCWEQLKLRLEYCLSGAKATPGRGSGVAPSRESRGWDFLMGLAKSRLSAA
jgi:hypothetical protein